jgi:hypothetical protein
MSSTGFTFSETMSGSFALGDAAEATLTMLATIEIDDLDKFIADPEHSGRLSGSISFGPFGDDLRADSGVFNLFSASDDSRVKLMVYELAFAHNGQAYYLAGTKHVHDQPGFDLWHDTTTLFTRLHAGTGKTSPVVGAGTLSLGVVELARLVSTMRVLGPAHAAPAALGKFGRFFLGELWDTYAGLAPSS